MNSNIWCKYILSDQSCFDKSVFLDQKSPSWAFSSFAPFFEKELSCRAWRRHLPYSFGPTARSRDSQSKQRSFFERFGNIDCYWILFWNRFGPIRSQHFEWLSCTWPPTALTEATAKFQIEKVLEVEKGRWDYRLKLKSLSTRNPKGWSRGLPRARSSDRPLCNGGRARCRTGPGRDQPRPAATFPPDREMSGCRRWCSPSCF